RTRPDPIPRALLVPPDRSRTRPEQVMKHPPFVVVTTPGEPARPLDQAPLFAPRRSPPPPASVPRPRPLHDLAARHGQALHSNYRAKVWALIQRVAGIDDPDRLTREPVQDVYDELERLISENDQQAA